MLSTPSRPHYGGETPCPVLCSRGVARCIASPLAALPTVPQAVLRIVLPAMDCIGFTASDAIHLLACSTAQFTPNGAPARHTLWTCSGRSGSSGDSHEHVPTSAVPSSVRFLRLCVALFCASSRTPYSGRYPAIPTDAACVFADLISAAPRSGQS